MTGRSCLYFTTQGVFFTVYYAKAFSNPATMAGFSYTRNRAHHIRTGSLWFLFFGNLFKRLMQTAHPVPLHIQADMGVTDFQELVGDLLEKGRIRAKFG